MTFTYMKIRNFILLSLVVVVFSQCTSYKATKITSTNAIHHNQGIVYSLPQTALRVDVKIIKEVKIKGPFAEYAEKLLGLKNVITLNQTSYKIADITINPENIPDTANQYLIRKSSFLKCRSSHFNFNQFGNISGINLRQRAIKDTINASNTFVLNAENVNYPNFFKLYADASQIEKIDTVYEPVRMDTIMMSKPIIKRTLITKTIQQRAEEAADYILKFRLKRYELITATQEIAYSKEAFEFMNNQLIKMENDYLELFTGITQTKNFEFSTEIIPNESQKNSIVPLFGFSAEKGVESLTEPSTDQYSLTFTTNLIGAKDTIPAKARTAIPYRNPEITTVKLLLNNIPLPQHFTIPILQYGVVRYLPKHIKSLVIDSKTGTISTLKMK